MKTNAPPSKDQFPGGWHPDPPDARDLHVNPFNLAHLRLPWGPAQSRVNRISAGPASELPSSCVEPIRSHMPPLVNQGTQPTCTGCVAAGIVGYYQKRLHGSETPQSILFNYQTSRQLNGTPSMQGSYLRVAMGSLALFGSLPDRYWPDQTSNLKRQPTPFCYAYAANYQAKSYHRLDHPQLEPSAYLAMIRKCMLLEIPLTLGFSLYWSAMQNSFQSGILSPPKPDEPSLGGHAVIIAGYDDEKAVNDSGAKGALLIRSSWGDQWGDGGYGWLPYEYVLSGNAKDCWAVLLFEWLDESVFETVPA